MQRILVPTDFSREAENALQTAVQLAIAFDATIILLHVLEVISTESYSGGDKSDKNPLTDAVLIQQKLKLAQKSLSRTTELHGLASSGIKYEKFIRIGNPSKQIEESIKSEKADFLIMGSKSEEGLNEQLLGTTTDKLLRRVSCPVLSVSNVTPQEAFEEIVFPTTTYNKEVALITVIKEIQKVFNSRINLVRINTPSRFMSDKESLRLLEEYANDSGLFNYETHVYSHTEEEDGIREFAHSTKGGFIAVSTSAHTGLRKILQGSVTKELVGHAKRPILTVKMDQ
jgi:nucleotide-binding universal stress UspA family protein